MTESSDNKHVSRQPRAETVVNMLNESLNARANEIRLLQDQLTYQIALVADLSCELDQAGEEIVRLRDENARLRDKLDIGPMELVSFGN